MVYYSKTVQQSSCAIYPVTAWQRFSLGCIWEVGRFVFQRLLNFQKNMNILKQNENKQTPTMKYFKLCGTRRNIYSENLWMIKFLFFSSVDFITFLKMQKWIGHSDIANETLRDQSKSCTRIMEIFERWS